METPRASSTDDVEYFFSVLRDTVGEDLTLKAVRCVFIIFTAVCRPLAIFRPITAFGQQKSILIGQISHTFSMEQAVQ